MTMTDPRQRGMTGLGTQHVDPSPCCSCSSTPRSGAADLVTGYFTTGNSITPYSVNPYSITRKFNHRENSSPCPFRHPANFVTLPISPPCQFCLHANFALGWGPGTPSDPYPPPNFSQKPKFVVFFLKPSLNRFLMLPH